MDTSHLLLEKIIKVSSLLNYISSAIFSYKDPKEELDLERVATEASEILKHSMSGFQKMALSDLIYTLEEEFLALLNEYQLVTTPGDVFKVSETLDAGIDLLRVDMESMGSDQDVAVIMSKLKLFFSTDDEGLTILKKVIDNPKAFNAILMFRISGLKSALIDMKPKAQA